MNASGTKSTTGDVYTFTDTESSDDNFTLTKTIPGSMHGSAIDSASDGFAMTGSTSTGPSGSTFGYVEASGTTSSFTDSGDVTVDSVVSPISLSASTSQVLQIVLAGPPATTATATLSHMTTLTGSNGGANFTETVYAGQGSTAGTLVAAEAGSSPLGSAEHQGTSPGSLDTSSGLLSALGGEAVHAMSFTGAEILPSTNPAGTSMWLEESNQSGQTPTNWVSHPSGIGYRRGSPGVTTSASGSHSSSTGPPIPGNAPTMDSGTSDGGAGQELGRLGNFEAGGNENPSATQPGPTPRAEQIAMPMLPIGGPAAVAISNTEGRDVLGDIMNDQSPGTWTPYGNPLYGSRASSGNRGSSEQSGQTRQQGYGKGGGGLTGPDGLVRGTGPVPPPPPPAAPPANPVPGSLDTSAVRALPGKTRRPPWGRGDSRDRLGLLALGNDDKCRTFKLYKRSWASTLQRMPYGATLAGLQAAIKNASNQGAKFRRIIILSHAGGEKKPLRVAAIRKRRSLPINARLHAGTLRPSLAKQINASLTPNGILVIATCGYYYEEATRGYVKPYRTRDPVKTTERTHYIRATG